MLVIDLCSVTYTARPGRMAVVGRGCRFGLRA